MALTSGYETHVGNINKEKGRKIDKGLEKTRNSTFQDKLEIPGQIEAHVCLMPLEPSALVMWVTCRGSWCASPWVSHNLCTACREAEGGDLAKVELWARILESWLSWYSVESGRATALCPQQHGKPAEQWQYMWAAGKSGTLLII